MASPSTNTDVIIYVTSDSLPLPLSKPISDQPLANALPLSMSRQLGAVDSEITPPSNDVSATISATAVISPTASASATADFIEVGVTVTAYCDLNATASMVASYDANVFRGIIGDVSGSIQQSQLQGISRQGKFESNKKLNNNIGAKWQQSRLVGTDNQAQFEASEKLVSGNQLLFEQSQLIGITNQQGAEYQTFIAQRERFDYEQAKLVGQGQWYGFEAMAKRQIERAIRGENSKLLTDKLSSYNEYGYLLNTRTDFLIEAARLPFSKLRYIAPDLSQTVILKQQFIDGWECGSGDLRHYVYSDELPLLMTRSIADRGLSSNIPLTMTMPRSTLVLSAIEAETLPNRPCKRKTLGINPTLDITMCEPRVFGKSSSMAVSAQATLNAIAWLTLIAGEKDSAYGQGVIFVTNSVSLNRTDDGRDIKMLSFDVGIDSNSYTWSFNATVPLSELPKVNTAYEQRIGVDLVVNGNLWRFILDGCDDNTSFGESSLTIKGKSRAMLLAHPYANQRGFKFDTAMSARQIAESELNRNGVPSGFTLDWQLAGINGWDVPANTYSYTGKTPINSLQWIAEAAGGFINAHMSADIIHVLANYPTPSWEWAAQRPAINLPISLITSRSRGRVYKPNYNGVQVWGERAGSIGALIKRAGTSGGYTPPMITSDLITDTAAAISRGKAVLSDVGDIGNINIAMPLHDDFGVLKPSTLIGVNDGEQWIGMVRGTKISGKLDSNQTLEIEQSIDIERHFDKELIV